MAGMRDAFAAAYKDGRWHNGSGSGSSPANTRAYRAFLTRYMRNSGNYVKAVLDLGCGDWQMSRLIDWTGILYLGIDVVPDLIDMLQAEYGRQGIGFTQADILDVDWHWHGLIVCKDVLQHWPDGAIHRLGDKLGDSKQHTGRALLTYDLNGNDHADIEPGGHRPLDLSRPPFSWPVREVYRYISVSHEGAVRRTKVVHEL